MLISLPVRLYVSGDRTTGPSLIGFDEKAWRFLMPLHCAPKPWAHLRLRPHLNVD